MSIEQSPTETIHYFDYKVEGTRQLSGATLTGWRITTTDQATQHEHEYWVQNSEIFVIDLQARKPWNHATAFVIGKRATRISPEERQAVTRAITYWTPPMAGSANHGRMIKLITEGPYVGVGFRRSVH
jgi:hypothetical protein